MVLQKPNLTISIMTDTLELQRGLSQCKHRIFMYSNSHYTDETVSRMFYVYNGNSFTGKTASLMYDMFEMVGLR